MTDKSSSEKRIIEEFGHSSDDSAEWLSRVRYSADASMPVSKDICEKSIDVLKKVGLIEHDFETSMLWGLENKIVTFVD